MIDFNNSFTLQSETINAHIWNIVYHLTLILLLHYRVKSK